jgi:single-strand selective monofunctional uracil DNA glycosylase
MYYVPSMQDLASIASQLSAAVAALDFAAPVAHVYNPLDYAFEAHRQYLERFGAVPKQVVFLGMNPGPWGMVQTGVPFGEVVLVRDWMSIRSGVERPRSEHPKRPVDGFDCARSEVSGRRLWGWARDRFGEPERFFERFLVTNYCPLAFMEESGRNLTPDKLPAAERAPLFEACDVALRCLVEFVEPEWVVGIGVFAEQRAKSALAGLDVRIGRGLHPSPASPAANRGWAKQWEGDLAALGIHLPG